MTTNKKNIMIIVISILVTICLIALGATAYINRQAIYNRIMLEIIRGLFGPWI